jgi:hypothetical protein
VRVVISHFNIPTGLSKVFKLPAKRRMSESEGHG